MKLYDVLKVSVEVLPQLLQEFQSEVHLSDLIVIPLKPPNYLISHTFAINRLDKLDHCSLLNKDQLCLSHLFNWVLFFYFFIYQKELCNNYAKI